MTLPKEEICFITIYMLSSRSGQGPLLLERFPLADEASLVVVEGPSFSRVLHEGSLTGLHLLDGEVQRYSKNTTLAIIVLKALMVACSFLSMSMWDCCNWSLRNCT
jgi:hypothetical protein